MNKIFIVTQEYKTILDDGTSDWDIDYLSAWTTKELAETEKTRLENNLYKRVGIMSVSIFG